MEHSKEYRDKPPEFILRTGEDFVHDDEILELMIEKLRSSGVNTDNIVFSGYDADSMDEPHTELYGHTVQDYIELIEYSSSLDGTPLEYAMEAYDNGTPVIGAYDSEKLDQGATRISQHFSSKPGQTIEDAKLAVFYIE